jgi:hypothetical protein
VILCADLQTWAFADEHLVARRPDTRLRPIVNKPVVMPRRAVRQRLAHEAAAGSVERLHEIERSA